MDAECCGNKDQIMLRGGERREGATDAHGSCFLQFMSACDCMKLQSLYAVI